MPGIGGLIVIEFPLTTTVVSDSCHSPDSILGVKDQYEGSRSTLKSIHH